VGGREAHRTKLSKLKGRENISVFVMLVQVEEEVMGKREGRKVERGLRIDQHF